MIKPSQVNKIKTCGNKECRAKQMWLSCKQKISDRIGESVDDAVYRLYVIERRSYRYIKKDIRITNRVIKRVLLDIGVKPRGRSESVAMQWENNPERRKKQAKRMAITIREYYDNGGIPTSQLPGVGEKISRAKKKKNWMRGKTGSKNPNWRGGKKWWRGKDWEDRRKEILERDNYVCTRCGTTQEENMSACGMPLSVHHIVPYRLSRDNSSSNLKTLCSVCHTWEDYQFEWIL